MAGTEEKEKRKKYGYGRSYGRRGPWGCSGARAVCAEGAGYLLSAALLLGGSALSAEASPASLTSGSAVVYEHTSETSAPLENLIQDGTFEYLGDVTAEDGSVWHAVKTAGGASGYISGDIEIRALQTQQETPEHTGNEGNAGQAGNGANARQMGNEANAGQTGEQGAPAAQETAGENGAAGTEESEDAETEGNAEDDGEGAPEETLQPRTVENNRVRTYAAEALGKKIKDRENKEAENAGAERKAQDGERKSSGTDRTFLLCIMVSVLSAATAFIFLKKLERESEKRKKNAFPEAAVKRHALKNERKSRKSRRRKNRKHGKRHPNTNRESGGQRQNGRT